MGLRARRHERGGCGGPTGGAPPRCWPRPLPPASPQRAGGGPGGLRPTRAVPPLAGQGARCLFTAARPLWGWRGGPGVTQRWPLVSPVGGVSLCPAVQCQGVAGSVGDRPSPTPSLSAQILPSNRGHWFCWTPQRPPRAQPWPVLRGSGTMVVPREVFPGQMILKVGFLPFPSSGSTALGSCLMQTNK